MHTLAFVSDGTCQVYWETAEALWPICKGQVHDLALPVVPTHPDSAPYRPKYWGWFFSLVPFPQPMLGDLVIVTKVEARMAALVISWVEEVMGFYRCEFVSLGHEVAYSWNPADHGPKGMGDLATLKKLLGDAGGDGATAVRFTAEGGFKIISQPKPN
ncbi:MAG: hypothetical protein ACXVYB_16560 [Arthrobacter sp.]